MVILTLIAWVAAYAAVGVVFAAISARFNAPWCELNGDDVTDVIAVLWPLALVHALVAVGALALAAFALSLGYLARKLAGKSDGK